MKPQTVMSHAKARLPTEPMNSFIDLCRAAAPVLAIVVVASCIGQKDDASTSAGRSDTGESEHGIVVRNDDRGSLAPDRRWRLEEVSRIGSAGGDGPDVFGSITDLAVDPMDRIWVGDGMARQIRVFTADGEHVRTIGRQGKGPGEFDQLNGFAWGAEGKLWVADGGVGRYSVFDTTGTLVDTHRRASPVAMSPWPGGFDAQGDLHDITLQFEPGHAPETAVIRYSPDLEPIDTLVLPAFEGEYFETTSRNGRNIQRVNVPFSPTQVWSLAGNGDIWLGVTDEYRLYRLSPVGDTTRIVELARKPIPIRPDEKARILENYTSFVEAGGRIDRSRIPETHPPLISMFEGADEKLWVIPNRGSEQPFSLDVFDKNGQYIGPVSSPVRLLANPLPVVTDEFLYGVAKNDLGVQSVVRMRIVKPGT